MLYVNYISKLKKKKRPLCIPFICTIPHYVKTGVFISLSSQLPTFTHTRIPYILLTSSLQSSPVRIYKSLLFLPQNFRFHLCSTEFVFSCRLIYFILWYCLPEKMLNALRGEITHSDISQEHWLLQCLLCTQETLFNVYFNTDQPCKINIRHNEKEWYR